MKKLLGSSILIVFLLGACRSAATPTANFSMDAIYTAVAGTITAQVTVTATATQTPPPTPTPTFISTPTEIVPTATPSTWYWPYTTTYYGCDDATYIKDVTIPDGTVLAPGETFVKTWKFKNTGGCEWNANYWLVFISGDEMDGSNTELGEMVDQNEKAELSVSLTAPEDEGTYLGYWKLADEDGYTFGDMVYVSIVVSDDAVTSTPTATPTSVDTSTPTPSSTPTVEPSYTSTPTDEDTAASASISIETPTETPTIASTDTPTQVPTIIDTDTSTPTISVETPTETPTIVPTNTPTPFPTIIDTDTPTPTMAPTPTPDEDGSVSGS